MYSFSSSLSQNSLKNSFLKKVVFQILDTWIFSWNETEIFGTEHFLMLFLLNHDFCKCIQMWYKFRTEIPTGKYLNMVGSKLTPLVQEQKWKVA